MLEESGEEVGDLRTGFRSWSVRVRSETRELARTRLLGEWDRHESRRSDSDQTALTGPPPTVVEAARIHSSADGRPLTNTDHHSRMIAPLLPSSSPSQRWRSPP